MTLLPTPCTSSQCRSTRKFRRSRKPERSCPTAFPRRCNHETEAHSQTRIIAGPRCNGQTEEGRASGNVAIRQRIALVAAERKLDPSETKALMTGRRIPMQPLSQFLKKHNLSYDWVLAGDLKA
jgi:hypothetical protein